MNDSGPYDNPAVITGDFNNPRFYGRPNRPVEVGERVVAHDGDPTVGDYWAVVTVIRPSGLVYVDVTWEKADDYGA